MDKNIVINGMLSKSNMIVMTIEELCWWFRRKYKTAKNNGTDEAAARNAIIVKPDLLPLVSSLAKIVCWSTSAGKNIALISNQVGMKFGMVIDSHGTVRIAVKAHSV